MGLTPAARRGASLAVRAAAVVVAILALGRAVSAARERIDGCSVQAHRGFAGVAPENTVVAVETAAPLADAVEVDVRRCGSGDLVCVHDADLDRIAGVDARVRETDLDTLRTLSVEGSREPVAAFADVLAAVPDDTTLNVEIKERTIARDVLDAVDRHDVDVLLSSFDPVVLAEVRAQDPDVPLAFVFRSAGDVDRALSLAAEYDLTALHPRADLVVRTRLLGWAHRRRLDVNVWTTESPVAFAALALVGVDGVIADRPPHGNARPETRRGGAGRVSL